MKLGIKFLVLSLRFAFCLLAFTLLCGCQNRKLYTDNRVMMGTAIEVASPYKEAAGIVFSEAERLENLLSKYKPESEVSRLNSLAKLKASPEVFFVIKKSKEFWQKSEGAFDITVAPLLDLWGFTDKNYIVPDAEKIKDALRLVGSDKILLHDNDNMVEFTVRGVKIDLGAIAKGYFLDCAVKKLKEKGINSCLINAGGQVYCLGKKFGEPWRVAVRGPRQKDFAGYLELVDKSVATSGDYEQFFIKDNKRYSHILDPKTGYPSDSGIISVTVIAADALVADALATAIFVMGKDKAAALAYKFPGTEIRIVEAE